MRCCVVVIHLWLFFKVKLFIKLTFDITFSNNILKSWMKCTIKHPVRWPNIVIKCGLHEWMIILHFAVHLELNQVLATERRYCVCNIFLDWLRLSWLWCSTYFKIHLILDHRKYTYFVSESLSFHCARNVLTLSLLRNENTHGEKMN